MKKYLIILQNAPYANSQSLEAIELSLALAAFGQEVSLLFMGDGILQLLNSQAPDPIAHKAFTNVYSGLNLFDINHVYADETAIDKYGLDIKNLTIIPALVTDDKIISLIEQHDISLSF